MIISGKNLKLNFWGWAKGGWGFANLDEIEKGKYGYNLQPGQIIANIRYDGKFANTDSYWRCKIIHVCKQGLTILPGYDKFIMFLPWEIEGENLMVMPCEHLYEKNKLNDILDGNIDTETEHTNIDLGKGIWYRHGGWRTRSRFEDNLNYFVKLGQITI